jgi:DNA-binding transcriptional MerR regulator
MRSAKHTLLSIGKFSELSGLSIKVLRHYDQQGLLRPQHVSADSGYRYYAPGQVRDAQHIRLLRTLEIPLAEIRTIITERDRNAVRSRLDVYRRRIEDRVAAYRQLLVSLQSLIDGVDEPRFYAVSIKQVAAERAVSLTIRGTLERLGPRIARGFGQLYTRLLHANVIPRGRPGAVIHGQLDGVVTMELYVPIAGSIRGREPATIRGGTMAVTVHVGAYDDRNTAHHALQAWIADHGYAPVGPSREVYVIGPAQSSSPADFRTEVMCAVRRQR